MNVNHCACREIADRASANSGVNLEDAAAASHDWIGSSLVVMVSKGVTEEDFLISSAATQATVFEGVSSDDRSSQTLCGWAAPDGFEGRNGANAFPPASPDPPPNEDNSFSVVDQIDTGNFEVLSSASATGVIERGAEESVEVAKMAALLAVFLRRVEPCRESLNMRAQSAGAALLRSNLGSALFTRCVERRA